MHSLSNKLINLIKAKVKKKFMLKYLQRKSYDVCNLLQNNIRGGTTKENGAVDETRLDMIG